MGGSAPDGILGVQRALREAQGLPNRVVQIAFLSTLVNGVATLAEDAAYTLLR